MKNQNSKKITPLTYLALAFGIFLALTDDYIVEYFGIHPTLGVVFVATLLLVFVYLIGFKKSKQPSTNK